jgi:hypothetical protein
MDRLKACSFWKICLVESVIYYIHIIFQSACWESKGFCWARKEIYFHEKLGYFICVTNLRSWKLLDGQGLQRHSFTKGKRKHYWVEEILLCGRVLKQDPKSDIMTHEHHYCTHLSYFGL